MGEGLDISTLFNLIQGVVLFYLGTVEHRLRQVPKRVDVLDLLNLHTKLNLQEIQHLKDEIEELKPKKKPKKRKKKAVSKGKKK